MRIVSKDERDKISGMYLSVVKYYVVRFEELLGLEDRGGYLVKKALEGLFRGISEFDPSGDESIDRFIRRNILEGVLEGARELLSDFDDLLARTRELTMVFRALSEKLGRAPCVEEIASQMGVDVEVARRYLSAAVLLFSHDRGTSFGVSPYSPARTREELARRIESLAPDSQLVIALHHFEEFSFEEISRILGESRESVILSYARGVLELLLSP